MAVVHKTWRVNRKESKNSVSERDIYIERELERERGRERCDYNIEQKQRNINELLTAIPHYINNNNKPTVVSLQHL